MKVKSRARDFRVRELIDARYLCERGPFRVYLVTKTKLTSLEAAARLAELAGVSASEVGIAGLKDRQGVTTQYMSVRSKRPVFWKTPELRVEPAGFARAELTSADSTGNEFEVTLRGMSRGERDELERAMAETREHGIPNYFGEQRFGNLRYNQGWIARDLALGQHEKALKELLCARSANDNDNHRRFKSALTAHWGDWRACRDVAGKFGAHHSIFEHLARTDDDFAGAFRHVAARVRLIHLYAWQSHLWNRALARYVEEITDRRDRIEVAAPEGRLFFARKALAIDPAMRNSFRLPGEKLADVDHPRQRELLEEALAREGLKPDQYRIAGVPGFQLKGEDRALIVHPARLRASEARAAREERGPSRDETTLRLAFELPRGSYATLVLQRLLESERSTSARDAREDADEPRPRSAGPRPRFERGGGKRPSGPAQRHGDRRTDRPTDRHGGDDPRGGHAHRSGDAHRPSQAHRGGDAHRSSHHHPSGDAHRSRDQASHPRASAAHPAKRTSPRSRTDRGGRTGRTSA